MLDACRDNPFAATRSSSRGLTVISGGGSGSMTVFATAPGDIAQDGEGRNSPFTKAFLEHVHTPGLEVRQVITEVQRSVEKMTDGRQRPWMNTSFTGEFFFSTAEQQLARSRDQARTLEIELEALEAEIAKREAAIAGATSAEERRRLEAEQQRARAQEEAKRLEAQRLAMLRRQAEEAISNRQAQEALRREMQQKLGAEQAILIRQAEERRAELKRLRERGVDRVGLTDRLETIARLQAAIDEIGSRFKQAIENTLTEMERLHRETVDGFTESNPRDPWETAEEYQERIRRELTALETEYQQERNTQSRELEQRSVRETTDLEKELAQARGELDGMRFTLGAESTRVLVEDFDAYSKHFPINIRSTDGSLPFSIPAYYRIDSRDREVLRREYYRVFSAAQAGGLVGEIEYSVHEIYPHIWAVRPTATRVVNLLENDAIMVSVGADKTAGPMSPPAIVSAGGGEVLFRVLSGQVVRIAALQWVRASSSSGAATIKRGEEVLGQTDHLYYFSDTDIGQARFQFDWPDGSGWSATGDIRAGINPPMEIDKSEGATALPLIVFVGLPADAELRFGGMVVRAARSTHVITADTSRVSTFNLSSPWLIQDTSMTIPAVLRYEPVVWVDFSPVSASPAGRIRVHAPGAVVEVYDSARNLVAREVDDVPLRPGLYQITLRQPKDPYFSRIEEVRVEPLQRTEVRVEQLGLSTRFQLDKAHAALNVTEKRINRAAPAWAWGWTLLAAGVSGIAGSVYSYMQVRNATDGYNSAALTSEAQAYRGYVMLWGTLFGISAGIGVGGTALGGLVLGVAPGPLGLVRERDELRQRIKLLSEQAASEAARNPLFSRSVQ